MAFLQKIHPYPFEITQEQCPSAYYLLLFFYFSVPWSQHGDCWILCQLRSPAFLQRTGNFKFLIELYFYNHVLWRGYVIVWWFWARILLCKMVFTCNPIDYRLLMLIWKSMNLFVGGTFYVYAILIKFVRFSLKHQCCSNVFILPLLSSQHYHYTSI